MISFQGTHQAFNFSDQEDFFINIIYKDRSDYDNSIKSYQILCDKFNAKICAFIRQDKLFSIEEGDSLENGDEDTLICKEENIKELSASLKIIKIIKE